MDESGPAEEGEEKEEQYVGRWSLGNRSRVTGHLRSNQGQGLECSVPDVMTIFRQHTEKTDC